MAISVNVNRPKNFAENQKEELLMERRFLLNARRSDTMQEMIQWYRPCFISGLDPNRAVSGSRSEEKEIQKQRTEGLLTAIYFSPEM